MITAHLEKFVKFAYIASMLKDALILHIKTAASHKLSKQKLNGFIKSYMNEKNNSLSDSDIQTLAKIIVNARKLLKAPRL